MKTGRGYFFASAGVERQGDSRILGSPRHGDTEQAVVEGHDRQ